MSQPGNTPMCECGNAKPNRRSVGCARCLELDQQRYVADGPKARIAARLSTQEWSSTIDLYNSLDAHNELDQMRFYVALRKLVAAGRVERRKSGARCLYRLAS